MEVLAQSALLVSFTSFALGFATWARNVRNKLYFLYAVGCTVVSGWALFFFLSWVWPEKGYYGWHLLLNAWVTPISLAFIQYMMRIENWWSSRLLFWSSLVLCVVHAIGLSQGLEHKSETLKNIIYFTPTLIVLQTVWLMVNDKKLDPTVGITHRFKIYISVLVVLLTSVWDHIPGLWVGVPIFGNLALTTFLYFLSQALLRQRFLNFWVAFTRFLIIIVMAFLLTCVYSLVAEWVDNDFGGFFLNSFIISFFVLTLLDPIRFTVHFLVNKLIEKQDKKLAIEVKELQKKFSKITDPQEVSQLIFNFLFSVLDPKSLHLYLESTDQTFFHNVQSSAPGLPSTLYKMHSIVEGLSQLTHKTTRPILLLSMLEVERDRSAGHDFKEKLNRTVQALKELNSHIAIPFRYEKRLIGFALVEIENASVERSGNWSIINQILPILNQSIEYLAKRDLFIRQKEMERMATVGELAAGLAHEIRNPLGSIKGAIQYLDPQPGKPESRFLNVILEEVERLNRVVTQFLDYSKPEVLETQKVDLVALSQKTVTMQLPYMPRGVDLKFQSSLLKAETMGSGEKLHQVLLNLIQNAVRSIEKSKRPGKITVAVDLINHARRGSSYVLSVEDDGQGMSAENLKKIFIPFYTTDPSGTGLGLSICQKIIQYHNGEIEVFSELNQGAVFKIILPLEVANDER